MSNAFGSSGNDMNEQHMVDELMEDTTDDPDFVPDDADDDDDLTSSTGEEDEEEATGAHGHAASRISIDETGQLVFVNVRRNPASNEQRPVSQGMSPLQVLAVLSARVRPGAWTDGDDEGEDDDEEEEGGEDEEEEQVEYLPNEEADDDEYDDVHIWDNRTRRRRQGSWYPVQLKPHPAGVQLLRSGCFGAVPPEHLNADRKCRRHPRHIHDALRMGECSRRPMRIRDFGPVNVPNDNGTEVAIFDSRVYTGQFSADGSFFYTCSQNFHAYIYDMTSPPRVSSIGWRRGRGTAVDQENAQNEEEDRDQDEGDAPQWSHRLRRESRQNSSLKLTRMFRARDHIRRWTITDAALSADNNWMVYSSIAPICHLVKTRGEDAVLGLGLEDHEQEELDFSGRLRDDFGIWSLRFSSNGREIAAGCSRGRLSVFDLESRRAASTVVGHEGDVNAVCFADPCDPNIIVSGSDDSLLKVWDRRNLRSTHAAGILVGHTEGVTFVEGKGDCRYILSNGKDQGAKLWDLRVMHSQRAWNEMPKIDAGIPGFDYRWSTSSKPKYLKHPQDISVMTYRGHSVLQTLIRAHISPLGATEQQYIYSGSADGRIHIWHLDGRIAQVIERGKARPLIDRTTGLYTNPMSPHSSQTQTPQRGLSNSESVMVRDVSWHPFEPTLISTSWGGNRLPLGTLAMHHYVGHGKRAEAIERCGMHS